MAVASDPVNGPLIAVLSENNSLKAKQGSPSTDYVPQTDHVIQFAVATDAVHGPLIAIVNDSHSWRARQGSLTARWAGLRSDINLASVAS